MRRFPGIIRIAGHLSLWLSFAIIGYRIGWEVAIYHGGRPEQLLEASQLRWGSWHGRDPKD